MEGSAVASSPIASLPAVPSAVHSAGSPAVIAGAPSRPATAAALPHWEDLLVPAGVLAIVMAMIIPLPPFLLDFLIALNITLSVIVLLVGIYIVRPVDFSVFPTA